VLDLYQRNGLRAAERASGVHRETIGRWARDAGVDSAEVTEQVSLRNARAAAASAQRLFRERQERRERLTDRVGKVSEAALTRELQILLTAEPSINDLQALTNARMKAIQQLELLEGRATSTMDWGHEQILHGVALAFRATMELVSDELRQQLTTRFSDALCEVREQTMTQLELEQAEDAEVEEGADRASDEPR
jgi:hypothetical protein